MNSLVLVNVNIPWDLLEEGNIIAFSCIGVMIKPILKNGKMLIILMSFVMIIVGCLKN